MVPYFLHLNSIIHRNKAKTIMLRPKLTTTTNVLFLHGRATPVLVKHLYFVRHKRSLTQPYFNSAVSNKNSLNDTEFNDSIVIKSGEQ